MIAVLLFLISTGPLNVFPPEEELSVIPVFSNCDVPLKVEPFKYTCGKAVTSVPLNVDPD